MAQSENVEDNYKEVVLKNNQKNEDFVYIDLATHDFADMHLAIPQQQERGAVKTTILVAIKGSKLFKLKFGGTTIAPVAKNLAINLVNNSTNYINSKTTIGGRSISFMRKDMIHVFICKLCNTQLD